MSVQTPLTEMADEAVIEAGPQAPLSPSEIASISEEAVKEAHARAAKRRRTEYYVQQQKAIEHIVDCLQKYDGKQDDLEIDLTAFDAGNPDEGRAWLTEFISQHAGIKGTIFRWVGDCVLEFNFCP